MSALKTLITGPDEVKVGAKTKEAFKNPFLQQGMGQINKEKQGLGQSYLDQSQQDEFRQGQQGLISQLQARAAGTAGPSLAEQQLQQGQEANIKAQLSRAASQRGGYNPLAARQTAQDIAMGGQQVNQQAALLRSQEQQQAEQALAGALQAGRQQDIGVQQLSVQEQQARDQLIQQYVAMGLSLQQAQFQANQDFQKLRVGVGQQNAAAQQQHASGLLSGIAGVGAGLASGGFFNKKQSTPTPGSGG